MDFRPISEETYAGALPGTDHEVFHDPAALRVLERHAGSTCQRYGVFKGDELVALCPVFVETSRLGTSVLSPPPGFGVPRLGPVIAPNSPKQHKRERITRTLVNGLIEDLDLDRRRTLTRILCPLAFDDPRPFGWEGFNVDPQFTYIVDLAAEPDAVMRSFGRSLRREVRDLRETPLEVTAEGIESALEIHADVRTYYDETGNHLSLPAEYVRDLLTELDDRRYRVYVIRDDDGAYVGGIIALFSDQRVYFWLGGVRRDYGSSSVNSLLHWTVIEDAIETPPVSTVTEYDLVGANTPRLCEYKGKFNGRLRPYYLVESAGVEMSLAKSAYRAVAPALK